MTCSGLRHSKLTNKREVKQCLSCNNDFEVVQSYKEFGKYCSSNCFYKHKYNRESKIIILRCEACGKDYEKKFIHRKSRFCSKVCATSGDKNSQFGLGKEQARNKVPRWHIGKTKETDERLRRLGEKISVIIADKIVKGEWKHIGFKGEHYTGLKNGGVVSYLRSSYESIFARILDSDDNVVSWNHEPFRIPYLFEGSVHNYVPDFYVKLADGTNVIVEVKPEVLIECAVNVAKHKAALDWCNSNDFSFALVSEQELNLGTII